MTSSKLIYNTTKLKLHSLVACAVCDPSNPTTDNHCATFLTSCIEPWSTICGPHLPWGKNAVAKFALKNEIARRKAPLLSAVYPGGDGGWWWLGSKGDAPAAKIVK